MDMAKLYYDEFRKQMKADPTKQLKIAVIYSYAPNEEEADGILTRKTPKILLHWIRTPGFSEKRN